MTSRSSPRASRSTCTCDWPIRPEWKAPPQGSAATMAIEFAIEDHRAGEDTHVVAVTGEIDLFTAPEFKQRMSQPIDDGVQRLVVDLSHTTFIDSSSLGVLIGAHRRLKQRNGSLVVVCDNDTMGKTLKITGFDGVFPLVRSLAAALEGDAVGGGP